ncbi:Protein of unknown function DUF247, plant [Dillenia turbinata]|uniref:Uncharacterized protein n=1 Tax=Dillenia turbinata TaxID=194707 RepID=A0AAN8Z4Y1_9MAGN
MNLLNNPNRGRAPRPTYNSVPAPSTEWRISMEQILAETPRLLNKSAGKKTCCIFRVPQSLVEINEKAYQPHVVSIGPYHHGRENLKMIEQHKGRFLGSLVSRSRVGLDEYYKAIASREGEIRDCYSETINYDSNDFIKMLVLDGCFIIELFCKVGKSPTPDSDDPLFNMAWLFSFVMRDLLRLENQIPYFVLEAFYDLATGNQNLPSLSKLALEFFNYAVQRPIEVLEKYYNIQGVHLLDLFRRSFIPTKHREVSRKPSPLLQLIPSAKKLHVAGVKFKARDKSSSLLEIDFHNGLLRIPTMTIDDFTSSVFLNWVAFEQCYNHCSKHITTYATFMGCLINTAGDAGLLCDQKIIENYFGTDEAVTSFFTNVGKDVVFDIQHCYMSKMFEDINEYYRNNWKVQWAGFKHKYFDTPWSFLSALAAVLLLLLTLIQSLFSVLAYVKPPGQGPSPSPSPN